MTHEYPYSIKRHGTTLEKCEDEPVQTPGCIQAHGALLVLRQSDLTIVQASENSRAWLGFGPAQLLGKSVGHATGDRVAQIIRRALDTEPIERAPLYLTTLDPGERDNVRGLHVSLHTYAGLALVELEDAGSGAPEASDMRVEPDYYAILRTTLTRFQQAASVQTLCESITDEVRRITHMDRVMVYRFHADDSGEIVAEAKRDDHGSWLGWRYPAHDIPRPAREIFKKIWSRPVPDVRAELFEMVPLLNPDTQLPLDMTFCSLRGASVMYTEYLDNMGIRAALTLPIMRAGELWGMIACHHDTPLLISYRIRAACEFLARGASQQLSLAEEREDRAYRNALEAANYALISKLALKLELSAFTDGAVRLGSDLDCGGAAIFFEETWSVVGRTPDLKQLSELGEWLLLRPAFSEGSREEIFVTDALSQQYPAAQAFAGSASGLIAFCFSRTPVGLICFFKPQTLQTFTWAGNPNQLPAIGGVHGARLSPRKSFEIWREMVRDRSLPWKKVEVNAIHNLRGLIIDMLVSRAEQLHALRRLIAERTRELEQTNDQLHEELRYREIVEAQLERYAFLDGLTEIANRRKFDDALEREWHRAIRERSSIALLMIDVDVFKNYNDRYGHQMGDEALKKIAGCIVSSLSRPTDVGARYGGEEFAVLMPGTTASGGRVIAEKIRTAVVGLDIAHAGNVYGVASVSVGVAAMHPILLDDKGALVRAADRALYDAKRNGRNRVEISLESGVPAMLAEAGRTGRGV